MKLIQTLALLLLLGTFGTAANAAEEALSGVITSVDRASSTITVRDTASGDVRSYFLTPGTRITSKGQSLPIAQVKRGQQVELRFRRTNAGREVVAFRVPEPLVILDLVPFTVTEELQVSGEITGLRKATQTVVVRDASSRERRAVQMGAATRISRDGKPLTFRQLQIGDTVALRYRVTEQGLIVVTGRAPVAKPVAQVAAAPLPAMLPKTAGNGYQWLIAGGLLLAGGLGLRMLRQRSAA